ncbi:MAG TPA: Mur ligase family protein [Actinomycetota bacterium]|nr:Mur ligase family protein [Actinomycetota bacterium]
MSADPVEAGAYVPPPGSIPTLPVPDLAGVRRAHLIGIGGAGMSGIARLLLARGVEVTGSDLKASRALDDLRAAGARVHVGHREDQVGEPDVVVVSSAIREGNPELAAARARGIPVLARAQVLAALAARHRTLAVAGTHGKTTTTSMLAWILDRAGLDPTFVVGGDVNEIGSGARHGGGGLFVAEADESDGSFLLLRPEVAVVTNVEEDHLDFYAGGRAEIEAAFARFVRGAARVVACGDDPGVRAALSRAGVRALTYGTGEEVDARARVVREAPAAGLVAVGGGEVEVALPVPGAHNVLNAAAAILAAGLVGVPAEAAAAALASFPGVSGELVAEALREARPGLPVAYLPHRADVVSFLLREVREGDLVLTLGAGDVTAVADEVLHRLGEP